MLVGFLAENFKDLVERSGSYCSHGKGRVKKWISALRKAEGSERIGIQNSAIDAGKRACGGDRENGKRRSEVAVVESPECRRSDHFKEQGAVANCSSSLPLGRPAFGCGGDQKLVGGRDGPG